MKLAASVASIHASMWMRSQPYATRIACIFFGRDPDCAAFLLSPALLVLLDVPNGSLAFSANVFPHVYPDYTASQAGVGNPSF